jgi:hypothetical protein
MPVNWIASSALTLLTGIGGHAMFPTQVLRDFFIVLQSIFTYQGSIFLISVFS